MKMPSDIDDEFEEFMRMCNPFVEQTSVQYKESRRVFFAGMESMLRHLTYEAACLSEEDALAEIKHVQDQLVKFAERVKEEKD